MASSVISSRSCQSLKKRFDLKGGRDDLPLSSSKSVSRFDGPTRNAPSRFYRIILRNKTYAFLLEMLWSCDNGEWGGECDCLAFSAYSCLGG